MKNSTLKIKSNFLVFVVLFVSSIHGFKLSAQNQFIHANETNLFVHNGNLPTIFDNEIESNKEIPVIISDKLEESSKKEIFFVSNLLEKDKVVNVKSRNAKSRLVPPLACTATISGTNLINNGASTTLTASAGSSYAWTVNTNGTEVAAGTSQSINVTPANSARYTVTVTDASNCTSTASTVVYFKSNSCAGNLLTNPSFESGFVAPQSTSQFQTPPSGGWVGGLSEMQPYTFTNNVSDGTAFGYTNTTNGGIMYQEVAAVVGNTYSLQFYSTVHAMQGQTIKLQYYDAAGAPIGTAASFVINAIYPTWTPLTTLTLAAAPSNATKVRVSANGTTVSSTHQVAKIDGVCLTTSTNCSISVTDFKFTNTSGGSPTANIIDGGTYNINSLPSPLTLEAITTGTPGSVKFTITGAATSSNIENSTPFNTPGTGTAWSYGIGTFTIKAEAFTGADATGTLCSSKTITFTLNYICPVWSTANNVNICSGDPIPSLSFTSAPGFAGYVQWCVFTQPLTAGQNPYDNTTYKIACLSPEPYFASATTNIVGSNLTGMPINNTSSPATYYVYACIKPIDPLCKTTWVMHQVTVNPKPSAPSITVIQPTTISGTGSVTISPLSGHTYSFDGGAFSSTLSYSGLAIGSTHTVVAKNAQGCISPTNTFSIASFGERCFVSPTVPGTVWAKSTWSVNNTAQTVTIRTTFSKTFVDNTYGSSAIGWPSGHTFSNLTGSDALGWSIKDANGVTKLAFEQDYISASSSFPSGYGTLGFGGDGGNPTVGATTDVLAFNTSMAVNFNTYNYVLTTNSPATDALYTPNPTYPNWINDVWYEVTVKLSVFGAAGFGYPDIASIHASPSKTGNNTEVVTSTSCAASLGDYIWIDNNGNGIQEAGEAPLSGVIVTLNKPDGTTATATTNASGFYQFTNLSAGTYSVSFPTTFTGGYSLTTANQGTNDAVDSDPAQGIGLVSGIVLYPGQINGTIDAGYVLSNLNLGNKVFYDSNRNGIFDTGEAPLASTTVRLYKDDNNDNIADGAAIATTTTDANGIYAFTNLAPGNYIVGAVLPAAFITSGGSDPDNNTDNDNNGSIVVGNEARGNAISLASGTEPTSGNTNNTYDIGIYNPSVAPIGGERCFASPTVPNIVSAKSTWSINSAAQTVTIRATFSKTFADNTYGTSAIGWPSGHTFGNLTGSDNLGWSLKDANGVVKLAFQQDYVSSSASFPSGYGTLGFGGDGNNPTVGVATDVLDFNTSMDVNFNNYNYILTTNSPATDALYTPNPTYPNWINEVWYEVTVKLSVFGTAGFGYPEIASVHASPSKTGNNTEVVNYVDCANASLGNFIWNDINSNGIQDSGENGIAGVLVTLTKPGGTTATTTSDATGFYQFTGLIGGSYTVSFGIPSGYARTIANQGTNDALDSDASATTGMTSVIALASGENNPTIDAGYVCIPVTPTFTISQPLCYGATGTLTINSVAGVLFSFDNGPFTSTLIYSGLIAGSTHNIRTQNAIGCISNPVIITINNPTDIVITPTVINVLCNGSSTGSINLSVSGGTGTYSYNWGGGITTQNRSGLAAGTYSVTVTDGNGCTKNASFTISQPSVLTLSTTQTNILCNGASTGAIDLTVTGGTGTYTYNWGSGQPTTQDRTGLAAGTYTVIVTDANSCTKSISATITQPPVITLSTTQTNVTCFGGSNGAIDLTVSGGTGTYTYNWGSGQPTTQDRTGLTAGTYTVIVTDANGCTKSVSTTITQTPALVLTSTQTNVLCNGASTGAIDLTVSGGTSPYTYNWGSGQPITQDRTGLPAGNYTVIVTDGSGCSSSLSFTITQLPALNLSTTQVNVNCNGASTGSINLTVTGGTSPYTFNWGSGQPTTEDRTGLIAGTYSVTVTDANGCTSSISTTISQLPQMVLSTTQTNILCNGASTGAIDLTVTGGTSPYTYNWGGVTTQDRTGLSAGIYTVTVTDANGCTKTISATITELPAIVLSTTQVNVNCNGGASGSIDLTVSGGTSPYTYNWGDGITTQDRTGLLAGTYTVTVTDANNCTKTISATITQLSGIVLSTTQVNVTCFGASTGSIDLTVSGGTPAYTYNWGAGQPNTQDRTGLSAGTYTVTVTDANGCSKTISATITQAPIIAISSTQTNVSCFGGSNGAIDISVSGGTGAYTYNWGVGQPTTQDRTGLAAGTYTVIVTDANLCTAQFTATITQPNILTLSTTQVNVLCNGANTGSIDLTVSGGTSPYTYNWGSGQPTTQDRTGLTAGTYTVTVTDALGCIKTISATITQPTIISLSTTQTNVSCFGGSNGTINLTVTGGVSPYTFNWGSGQPTTEDRNGLLAGTYSVTVTDANGCTMVTNVTITEAASIVLSTTQVNVLCNGASTGSIDLTVSGGVSPYTYNWGSGQPTTQDRTGLAAGTYSVTVTDANLCTKIISVTITQPTLVVLTSTQINVLCNGGNNGSIDLTVSGGVSPYTYNWGSGQPTTQDRFDLIAGTYAVTITDANNCTKVLSITITQPNPIILSTTQTNVSCFGTTTGSIDLTVSGGVSPYTFNWGSGQPTTEDRTGLAAGTYSVTVTDANNCTKVVSVTITQPSQLVLSTTQTNPLCNGTSTGTIDLTVSGGVGPYTYNWGLNQPTTQDRSALAAGTYSVTVTDANNCTKSISVTITQPAPIALSTTQVNVLCNGALTGSINLTVTGGVSPYTYNWGVGQPTTEDRTNLAAGLYTVIVTDANGCTNQISTTITQPTPLSLSSTQVNVLCNGESTGSIDLTVSGGTGAYTYNWGSGQPTTQDRSGLAVGIYTVTVSDANGCTSTISVAITQPAELVLSNTQSNVLCFGATTGAIDLTVSGGVTPYSYSWSSGQTTQDVSGLAAGTYNVTVTDGNGCKKTISATITQPTNIVLSTTQINVLCNGASTGSIDLTVSGGVSPYTYNWGSGQATSQDRTGLAAGTYSVTVTDANGCSKTTSVTITQPNLLSLSTSQVNVLCNGASSGSINLSIVGGVAPFTFNWGAGQPTTEDRSGLSAGSYSVTVTDANGCTSQISATITQPDLIAISKTQVNVLCNGNASGSIDLTVTGGVSPYSYFWGSGQPTTEDRTGLTVGTYTVVITDANMCTSSSTVTITQPTLVVLSTTQVNVLCNGNNTGSVDLTVSGGVSPYTYIWSNGATSQDISGIVAGTYTVTITDANGCIKNTSVTITQPSLITISTTQVNVLCNGNSSGSIDLTVANGTPGYTYLWSNGATSQDLSNLSAGTYSVTITDANGCIKNTSVTITQPSLLVVSTTKVDVACFGNNSGSIDLTVSGGVTNYTYLWSNGATSQDLTNIAAGTYTVIVTDANGCSKTATITIIQPTELVASSTGINVLCNGASTGSVDLTVSGGTPNYTYLWSNGATSQDLANVPAGTYSVTVTDANGCSKTSSTTITQPTLLALSSTFVNISCFGTSTGSIDLSVSGGVSPYGYLWSNGATTEDISSLPIGTYSVSVTDANGCKKTLSVTITEPPLLVLSATQVDVACNGGNTGAIDLSVTGGSPSYTYLWSNGATTQDLSSLSGGTYTVTVTDSKGCTKSLTVNINQNSNIQIAFTKVDVLCNGFSTGSINITASGGFTNPQNPYTYNWGGGITTEDRTNIPAGNYTVIVADGNGCTTSKTITITEPPLIVLSNTKLDVTCFGSATGSVDLTVVGGTGAYTYLWNNGATSQDISGLIAGTYSVTVTDANACSKTMSVVINQPAVLALSSTQVNVLCNEASTGSIDLSVLGGTLPYTYVWSNGSTSQDISNLPAGTYNVTVTDAKGCIATRSVTISQPPLLVINSSKIDVACFGQNSGSINLTVSGGVTNYTYLWNNGATTEDLNNLTIGTYSVTVTDANGCSKTASFVISEPEILVLSSIKTDLACNNISTGAIDLTVTGGTMNYSYLWSNGATTQDLTNLAAGTYSVTVTDAKGCIKTASITLTQPNPGSIGNYVWIDADADGIQDSGELPLAGISVKLYLANPDGTPNGAGIATGVSDASGLYNFPNVCAGNYVIEFGTTGSYVRTTQPNNLSKDPTDSDANSTTGFTGIIIMAPGENDPTNDAGFYIPASLGNFVWDDKNANGVQDSGEPGISNASVTLNGTTGAGNTISLTTTTDLNGLYLFTNLAPGNYSVTFSKPTGFTNSSPVDQGGNDQLDSDANIDTGITPNIVINSGDNNLTIDAGFFNPASLGDYVWEDTNANGQQDNGEPGIANVTVSLEDVIGNQAVDVNGNFVPSTSTNSTGFYTFTNLKPGIPYVVVFSKPAGYTSTIANSGSDLSDSDANITTGKSQPVTLSSGENNPTIDAGFFIPSSLGDFVWDDKNGNGIQDGGESGIPNVVVNLTGTDGNGNLVSATTNTNSNGQYSFINLIPGSYTVTFVKPLGYSVSGNDLGGNDILDSDANTATGQAPIEILGSGENNTTIDAGFYKPASLGDYVWEDKNANGQQDAGESFIANVVVSLEDASGNQALNNDGLPVANTITNGLGIYSFTNLKPGITYIVKFTAPVDYIPTAANVGFDVSDSDASLLTGKANPVILSSGENNTTIDAGFYRPASIGDFVWDDLNANGVQDLGELGIPGAIVSLTGTDAAGNPVNLGTLTGSMGEYSFTNLAPGNYTIIFTKPASYTNSSPTDLGGNDTKDSDANVLTGIAPTVILVSGDNNTTIDAGYYKPASLGDYVWDDKNANGIQDSGEPVILGVNVSLQNTAGGPALDINGNVVSSTSTNASGLYSFTNLKPGIPYIVVFSAPSGFLPTAIDKGSNDALDSDANITTGKTSEVILASGENNPTIDAGYYKLSSIGNFVWEDKDADGLQDSNESGIQGVTVNLTGTDGANNPVSLTTTTGTNGQYLFGNLVPGDYIVTFVKPTDYKPSPADIGSNNEVDSDANISTGATGIIPLNSGENNLTIDAGFYKPASLGDYVWEDKNANGQQDSGEPFLANVTVSLEDAAGNPALNNDGIVVASTTTNSSGNYSFTNLKPGIVYVVKFTAPSGFVATSANSGPDATDSDANVLTGKSQEVILSSGENNPTIDAGFYNPASLGDFVFHDLNGNGIQDGGEPGIPDASVSLSGIDAAGNIITASTFTNGSGLYSFTGLAPGNYTITFAKPAGYSTSSPADLGLDNAKDSDANIITGVAPTVTLVSGDNNTTIDAGYYNLASLGDFVWEDKNANGIQDSGEPGISGVLVTLTGTNSLGNPVSATTNTGSNGEYSFTNLNPGSYTVNFTEPIGYETTSSDKGGIDATDSDANTITGNSPTITLTSGQNNPTIDAGYYLPASLGNFVFEDKNANGVQDLNEPGIGGVMVKLNGTDGAGNTITATTNTNSSGQYIFNNLPPGEYSVTFTKPSGYSTSPSNVGDDTLDSDANSTTGTTASISLVSGETNTTLDAGYYIPASLGNFVWEDKNANGQQDPGEPFINGVTVSLENTSGGQALNNDGAPVANQVTSGSGLYNFTNLKPGIEYIVKFTAPAGFVPTTANLGSDITDSDANVSTSKSQTVILASGENNLTIDAGYYKPASLGNFVFDDKNANGIQDVTEPGIPNATVNLTGTDGAGNAINLTTVTDGSGLYSFNNLTPGSYQVTFEKPANYTAASPVNLGGNDEKDSDANPVSGIVPSVTLVSGENNTTIDAGFYKLASLGNYVWEDTNANGIQEPTESGIANVVVNLTGTNSLGNPVSLTTNTGSLGEYTFDNLLPGTYQVAFVKPAGYATSPVDKGGDDTKDSDANLNNGTTPSVTLLGGESNTTIDAGYYKPASLGDFVWEDKNANGIQDSGEPGIQGVTVSLTGTDGAGNPVSTTTNTDVNGAYSFTNLVPGSYTVSFSKPAGFITTTPNLGGDDTKDSDADKMTGSTPAVILVSGENNPTIDAGYYKPASIGDFVFADKDADGIQDLGENGIPNVTVRLTGTDGAGNPVDVTVQTGPNGEYLFSNLAPGSYVVTFTKPAGYTGSPIDATGDDSKDSDANPTTGATATIVLASGENNTTVDAGFYLPASLGDYVWEDKNANGQQDSGEPIIANVTVSLLDNAGNQALDINGVPVPSTVTNGSGLYSFTNLKPGIPYVVMFTSPAGYIPTIPNTGPDVSDSDADITTGKAPSVILASSENNLTIDAGFYKPAGIGDFVWEDKNANGIQDSGELGIANATVSLSGTDTAGNPVFASVLTGPNGDYLFSNLAPGNYTVIFTKPAGYTNFSPSNQGGDDLKDSDANPLTGISQTVSLLSGDNNTTVDAGVYKPASLGDYVWEDTNANGQQDSGEPVITNVTVSLQDASGNPALNNDGLAVPSTTTNSSGLYSFSNLKPGITYVVKFATPVSFVPTFANIGDDIKDSDANITTGLSQPVVLSSGENNPTIDAGYYKPASLGNFVWDDKNANGVQDLGEPGIPNVIVTLTGTDGAGNPVSATTNTNNSGVYSFTNLTPGSYIVNFDAPANYTSPSPTDLGGNDATDSDPNALGTTPSFTLASGESNQTIDAGFYIPASLGDYVWNDVNGNGQQNASEPVIPNVIVSLEDAAGNQALNNDGLPIASTLTDANGLYNFTNLKPGVTYIVKFTTPDGYLPTSVNTGNDVSDSDAIISTGKTAAVILASGENNPTTDAGYYLPAKLGDYVWQDTNANGAQDSGEPGITGVIVNLSGTDGAGNIITATTMTGINGGYLFDNLAPGTYTISFVKPADYQTTKADVGGNDNNDSDANQITGIAPSVTLMGGDNNTTIDAGYYKLGTIGNFVWNDLNANGIQDSGEPGIPMVSVSLIGTDGQGNIINQTIVTGPNGEYSFTNLIPGNYTVIFTRPNGYTPTTSDVAGSDEADSDANSITGITPNIPIVSGTINNTIDAGFYKPASLGDYVWEDKNANGIQDTGELGVQGVVINLSNGATTTTDANGAYSFTNLTPGTYTVTFVKPADYLPSPANEGSNDATDSDANTITGASPIVTLTSGETNNTIDAGFVPPASIGNFVWEDTNVNGIQDIGELGISGVLVTITGPNGYTASQTTDTNGFYNFTGLLPGSYSITFGTPATYTATFANIGSDDTIDSDGLIINNILLAAGANNTTVDAGFMSTDCDLEIGGIHYIDNSGDADGVNGTPINGPLLGVYMTLLKDGAIYRVTPLDANGKYKFLNVPVGMYNLVMSTSPAGSTIAQLPTGYKTVSEGGDVSGTMNGEDTNGLSSGDGSNSSETTIIVTCPKIIYEEKERSFPEWPGHPYHPNNGNNGNGNGNGNGNVNGGRLGYGTRIAAGTSTYLENDFGITMISALPVTLVSFTGKATDEVINLTWKTSNEKNFSHFEVERSADSKEFGSIGKITAINSNVYNLQDRNPVEGVNYYRLKMVDNDGTYSYSKIISINFSKNENFVTVENPANEGKMNIFTNILNPKFVIYSTTAQNVEIKVTELGMNKYSINIPNYVSGTYFLVILSDNKTITRKVIVP